MRTRALLFAISLLAGGCSDRAAVGGGQSGSERTTPEPGCSATLLEVCCGSGDAKASCICSTACSTEADCPDPARPRCYADPSTGKRFCVPLTYCQ